MQKVVDDIIANYEIIGENNKNTILILHGWGRNLNDWMNVGRALSNNCKVILLDLPGHGGSSVPTRVFDTYDYANFVKDFIDSTGIPSTTIIGHSFGGKVSTVVASQSKKISKLFLIAASGMESSTLTSRIKILIVQSLKLLRIPKKLTSPFVLKLASSDYKNAGELLPSFKKIVNQKVELEAKIINVPTLIIWGENDPEVPIISAKKFRELIMDSHIRVVWGAGHHPHLEKPDKFLALLNEHL